MTPLGLNTAAVPETAALFPLSAAIPPAAEGSSSNGGAASSAFGDLLAATFAQSEQPQDVLGADLASSGFNTLSLADVWFAGLNVDLDALNASLEVEEAGLPADADGVDDEAAALMALAVSIPTAVPAWSIPLPVDESAPLQSESQLPDLLVGQATAPHRAGAMGAPPEGLPGGPEALTPQVTTAAASSKESAAVAPAVAVDAVIDNAKVEDLPVGQALSGAPAAVTQRPLETAAVVTQQPEVAAPTPVQESPVEEQPAEQLPRAIEGAPALQQTGRTRDSVAARLAEISGLGVSGEVVAKPAPGTSFEADSQSQSQTQDGATQDAFALGVKENATPARSVDGAAAPPVFSVAAPVAGPARAVVVEGATLPPAPPAATVPGPENVGRLIESMRIQMRQGVQEATVRLNPEHLGEVTISVRVERGAVSAVVNAETPAVQQWLEAQEDKLRSGLSDQGLHLAKFIVQRDGSQQHREQPQQQKPSARDRQQLDGAPIRFEVIV